MRASVKIAPLVAATVLSVAACGEVPKPPVSGTQPTSTVSAAPTGSTAEPARPLPDKDSLSAALLAPEELGAGYSANPALASNNPAAGLNTSLLDCAQAAGDPSSATAAQVYQGGPIGPFVVETITAMTHSGKAATLMSQLRTVKQNCHQFDGQMAGGIKLQITIDDLTIRQAGDETVAYRLTGTVPGAGAAIYAQLVTARSGRLVVLVSIMQMTPLEVSVTDAMVQAAVTKAAQKLP
jgi:hypothetical protein